MNRPQNHISTHTTRADASDSVKPIDSDNDGIPNGLERIPTGPLPVEVFKAENFWDTAFGRTLSGKNKAGKLIYGIAGAAISLLTGINIEPITQTITQPTMNDFFTDINFWTIIAFAFGILVTWLQTKTGATVDRLLDKADLGAQMYADFKAKDSAEGTKISDQERDQLLHLFGSIFQSQQQKK